MTPGRPEVDTEELVKRAAGGDRSARLDLLARHRDRLRRMVEFRFDRRLAPRLDPSDIVQEALADAAHELDEYLKDRPLPFYPWLRQFASQRIARTYERHVKAGKRSVTREVPMPLPDGSVVRLAVRLASAGTNPSGKVVRDEQRERVRAALARLHSRDRDVLALRYLEGLSNTEAAAVLGVAEGAVKMRHLRALERLRVLLLESE
jgi:RNA polymerase sigma-70 factor, ECF subfamily